MPNFVVHVFTSSLLWCDAAPASDALSSKTWWGRVGPPPAPIDPLTGERPGPWWGPSAAPPQPQTGSPLGKAQQPWGVTAPKPRGVSSSPPIRRVAQCCARGHAC